MPTPTETPRSPKKRPWTILGRLAQAIRDVGVFLGVQLGNWNAARQERALSTEYLQRIANDLRSDVENLEKRIQSWQTSEHELVVSLAISKMEISPDGPLGR